MNIAPISEPNTMIPAKAPTQKVGRAATVQVVERVARAALAHEERDRREDRDAAEDERGGLGLRHRREVDREDQAPDEHQRHDAAEVVDRFGGLVDVRGDQLDAITSATTASGSVIRKTEPHSKCSSRKPEQQRAERGDGAADARPERDRLRAARALTTGR